MATDKKNELLTRVYLVLLAFVLFAVLIMFRVVKISLIEGDKWRSKAESRVEWKKLDTERGNIFDSRGNILATSLPYFDIRMDLLAPTDAVFKEGIDSLAYLLAKDYPGIRSAAEWKQRLTSDRSLGLKNQKSGVRYTAIVNNINLDQLAKLKNYPILRLGKYRGGLITLRNNKRFKPFDELASRTIGVDRENASKVGLEAAFDKVLSGPIDSILMKKVSGNIWVPLFDPSELKIEKGDDIVTTLDMAMQDLVHQELEKSILQNQAYGGTAILMDVHSGAIKAMANLTRKSNSVSEDLNFAIGKASEPGSTFKIASYLAMLEDGYLELNDKVNLNGGKQKFYNLEMRDSHLHGLFEVTAAEAFKTSSNIGAAKLAQKYYGANDKQLKFIERLESFGLMDKTGIELPGEAEPYIKHPSTNKKDWYGTTIPWMAHGYELLETPLQMLNFCNAIANDGKLMKPYLVSEIRREGQERDDFKSMVLRDQIASPKAIQQMQALLKATVNDGTGKSVRSDIVSIAGKTGTTRVNYNSNDLDKKYNASFVGYFPTEAPKYSLLVVVYEPSGVDFYGGSVAGPVFKNVAEGVTLIDEQLMANIQDEKGGQLVTTNHAGFGPDYSELLTYMGLQTAISDKNKWIDIFPKGENLLVENKKINVKKVPDLVGMGLRDAVYIMESLSISYKVVGVGRVYKQTIKLETEIDDKTLILYLK